MWLACSLLVLRKMKEKSGVIAMQFLCRFRVAHGTHTSKCVETTDGASASAFIILTSRASLWSGLPSVLGVLGQAGALHADASPEHLVLQQRARICDAVRPQQP